MFFCGKSTSTVTKQHQGRKTFVSRWRRVRRVSGILAQRPASGALYGVIFIGMGWFLIDSRSDVGSSAKSGAWIQGLDVGPGPRLGRLLEDFSTPDTGGFVPGSFACFPDFPAHSRAFRSCQLFFFSQNQKKSRQKTGAKAA